MRALLRCLAAAFCAECPRDRLSAALWLTVR
jgi:hypothetical protein